MILVLKENHTSKQLNKLKAFLKSQEIDVSYISDSDRVVLDLSGDISSLDEEMLMTLDIVESIEKIQEPYKKTNRKLHPEDTIVDLKKGVKIGSGNVVLIAGPCSVESYEQMHSIAESVKKSGAAILRGGAFKPRTSPYAFQGMRAEGIEILLEVRKNIGIPIVSEITDLSQLDLFTDFDMIQVGARNMQNYEMLRELGHSKKPILLKRGFSATIQELLLSAEYIMAGGNENVVLCERGIRTFETITRNTLDVMAVPLVKELSHLPIIVDPSHSTGHARLVASASLAAVAAGADGLIIEVHNNPSKALSDGLQSITPSEFDKLSKKVNTIAPYAFKW